MRAKLFRNGRSQAVRLPASCRFEGTEVEVERDPRTGVVSLSAMDVLIAAHALALGRTLVSSDQAFAEAPGLQCVSVAS